MSVIFWCLILLFATIKPFINKPIAKMYPAEISSVFTSCWMIASVAISLLLIPIFGALDINFIFINEEAIKEYWPRLSLSILKGVLLWYVVKLMQVINKESTSSSVFFLFIAFAIGSTVNNLVFKEGLPMAHLFAFMGFGVLAVFFRYFGDMKNLSKQATLAFWSCVLIVAFFQCADHLVVKTAGWYPHLAISSIAMFVCALGSIGLEYAKDKRNISLGNFFTGIRKFEFKEMFVNKYMFTAGLVYVVAEYIIIYASGPIMAVSYVALALRMASPIVMLISAFIYKEKKPLNQALFGLAALLLASVIIFF